MAWSISSSFGASGIVTLILLDSVILIDHLNGREAATSYLDRICRDAVVSVVTRSEVLTGYPPDSNQVAVDLLEIFPLLEITKEVADLAAQLRRQYRWRLPDAFQAALAQTHKLQFATRNTRDFNPADHPFVTVPYAL